MPRVGGRLLVEDVSLGSSIKGRREECPNSIKASNPVSIITMRESVCVIMIG